MFSITIFRLFLYKSSSELGFFCYIRGGCPKWNLLLKFGPDIPLCGVLVMLSVSHSFFVHQEPSKRQYYREGTENCIIRFAVFIILQKTPSWLPSREPSFSFLNGDSQSNIWNYEQLSNAYHDFHVSRICFRRLNFGQAFIKISIKIDSEKGNKVLASGHFVYPEPKKIV